MADSRLLAVKALMKVYKDGAYSNIALNSVLNESGADRREKAFASALFYGVLDKQISLDYMLNSLMKQPFKKTSLYTAQVLRTGLYQILYMDSVPDFSAVNESVKLVKRSKESRNSGFVNAVLRNALRNKPQLPNGDTVSDLSIRYSCPVSIIESFINDYGKEDTLNLLKENLKAAPLIIRVNTTKIKTEELKSDLENQGIQVAEGNLKNSFELTGIDGVENIKGFSEGLFHIQDLASQTVCEILNPTPGDRVLDLCAAPGGKSFTLAEIMENTGEITACDLYEKRAELIKKGANRLGLDIISVKTADATVLNRDFGEFNCVLCDVPCSGLGIIRRKPEIKYKPIDDFSSLEDIQYKILSNAAKYVKSGGKLLYSTCTLRKNENEGQIEKFLKENPDFALRYEHTYMPHKDKTDGFFCALVFKR
ncbi:MAG: 16S rRNA (cytosine(967)-C(5))-methyltransferase RsmB [Clostridia bacterium]|nr:16S rRNA (cytosine(967)-C(5))-methyltransferase RsmB [Clostridia bacterium]